MFPQPRKAPRLFVMKSSCGEGDSTERPLLQVWTPPHRGGEELEEELYKDTMMEELPQSQDPGDSIVTNVTTEEEEELVKKEEEIPLQISSDPGDSIVRDVTAEEEGKIFVKKEEEIPLQISPDSGDSIMRDVKTEDEEEIPLNIPDPGDSIVRDVKIEEKEEKYVKEEEFPLQIIPG